MATTAPNMGLKVWNLLNDPYDHSQLADNWAKVDQHNHTEGKGVQIPTAGIENGAISGSKIGAGQISGEKLEGLLAAQAGINAPTRTYLEYIQANELYTNSTTTYTIIDQATVYVPVGSRLMFAYLAGHKSTTANGTITPMIDNAEIKIPGAGGFTALGVASSEVSTFYGPLYTNSPNSGLTATKGTAEYSPITTGMTGIASISVIGLNAGSHTVQIKGKAGASGILNVNQRNLWVWVEAWNS